MTINVDKQRVVDILRTMNNRLEKSAKKAKEEAEKAEKDEKEEKKSTSKKTRRASKNSSYKNSKESTNVSKSKVTSEDKYLELKPDIDFDDIKDDTLKDAAGSLFECFDSDSNGKLSNLELGKIMELLEDDDVSAREIVAIFEAFNNEMDDSVTNIEDDDKEKLIDTNLRGFKKIVKNYSLLDEIVKEMGYKEFFNYIDENEDGILDEKEIDNIAKFDKKVKILSEDDIKYILKDSDIDFEDIEVDISKTEDKKEADDSKNTVSNTSQTTPTYTASPKVGASNSGGYVPSTGGGSYVPTSNASYAAANNANMGSTQTSAGESDFSIDLSKVTEKDFKNLSITEINQAISQHIEPQLNSINKEVQTSEGKLKSENTDFETKKKENEKALDSAQKDFNDKEKAYREALNNDDYLNSNDGKSLKQSIETNLRKIKEYEKAQSDELNLVNQSTSARDKAYQNVSTCEENVHALDSSLTQLQGTINGLKNALAGFNNDKDNKNSDKKAEINAALEEAENQYREKQKSLNTAKQKLITAKEDLKKNEKAIEDHKRAFITVTKNLKDANDRKAKLDKDIEAVQGKLGKEVKTAKAEFDKAQKNLDSIKTNQCNVITEHENNIAKIKETLETQKTKKVSAENALNLAKAALNQKEQEKEYSNNDTTYEIDVEYDLDLTEAQLKDYLETVKPAWEQNKDEYQSISDEVFAKTGKRVPPELICAIHYRECNNNFNCYLQNGQPLGTVTTITPVGIYYEDFHEAAVKALEDELDSVYENYGKGTVATMPYREDVANIKRDLTTLSSVLLFSERYFWFRSRELGCPCSYVYGGTTLYTQNPNPIKVYSDTDPNGVRYEAENDRLGTYVIMKELMGF